MELYARIPEFGFDALRGESLFEVCGHVIFRVFVCESLREGSDADGLQHIDVVESGWPDDRNFHGAIIRSLLHNHD